MASFVFCQITEDAVMTSFVFCKQMSLKNHQYQNGAKDEGVKQGSGNSRRWTCNSFVKHEQMGEGV